MNLIQKSPTIGALFVTSSVTNATKATGGAIALAWK